MRQSKWLAVVVLLLCAAAACSKLAKDRAAAQAKAEVESMQAKAEAAKAAEAKPGQDPTVAAPKTGGSEKRFMELHESFLKRAKEGPIGLLFIGDSITEGWTRQPAHQELWNRYYGKYNPANFGIGGDRTQHVLWRIANGELEGISPKVVVLMIGTNNTSDNTAESIAEADRIIVRTIRKKLPKSKVLLLGVFPRSRGTAEQCAKIAKINAELAKLDDGKTIRCLDIGNQFLDAQGSIPVDIMADGLHPNAKGYQIWAEAMQPLLVDMMR